MAREPSTYDIPRFGNDGVGPRSKIMEEVFDRVSSDFPRWNELVSQARFCDRPIRVQGKVDEIDRDSGEVRTRYSTVDEPDGVALLPCKNRRASKCRSCSTTYRHTTFALVAAGLRGGLGVPASVGTHPAIFVTLTAPSSGPVHSHRVKGSKVLPCRPRDKARRCPHGRPVGCSVRHQAGDAAVGRPLCEACFDYEGQVLWNAMAPALWHRTWSYLPRELARVKGMTRKRLDTLVRPRAAKVAEYQRRGAIHFHAVIRLDGVPDAAGSLTAPPEGFGVNQLEAALRAAVAAASVECRQLGLLGRQDRRIRWGDQLDVRPIREEGAGAVTLEAVAGYVAKYAVKLSEGMGLPDRPIESDDDVEAIGDPHLRVLVRTAGQLSGRPGFEELKLGRRAHGLGFGGHFLTKSRQYSTTMTALRAAQQEFRRRGGTDRPVLDAWGRPEDDDLVSVRRVWSYAGWGYQSEGEAWLASTAAARAREERELAREAMEERWAA